MLDNWSARDVQRDPEGFKKDMPSGHFLWAFWSTPLGAGARQRLERRVLRDACRYQRSRTTTTIPTEEAMRLWDDNTYNTQERAGIINSLGHTPKPDGAMERLRLPEVLYDNSVVH